MDKIRRLMYDNIILAITNLHLRVLVDDYYKLGLISKKDYKEMLMKDYKKILVDMKRMEIEREDAFNENNA